MAATNVLDGLDPALIREGRFDLQVRVDLPDEPTRKKIFKAELPDKPWKRCSLDDFARRTPGAGAAKIKSIVDRAVGFAANEPRFYAVLKCSRLARRLADDRMNMWPHPCERALGAPATCNDQVCLPPDSLFAQSICDSPIDDGVRCVYVQAAFQPVQSEIGSIGEILPINTEIDLQRCRRRLDRLNKPQVRLVFAGKRGSRFQPRPRRCHPTRIQWICRESEARDPS